MQLYPMKILRFYWLLALYFISFAAAAQMNKASSLKDKIIPAAERMETYLPFLKNKRVAVFANATSMVNHTHLVDTLLKSGINVVKIFGPEHGFRGDADAGEEIGNMTDKKTGIPIISLYGDHKKPTAKDFAGVDVLLFDIQDVGVRFYTYISSLEYFIEAALENSKPLLILDRPNPNGFYVDGPVLEKEYKSFVGMQPIPIVYGMTMGEYAMMLMGENWLSPAANAKNKYNVSTNPTADTAFHVMVIKNKGYNHNSHYRLPVNPSPNLKQMQSIYWYPSTCFFEGTVLSEGRGTDSPFQIFGHPDYPKNLFSFTPNPNEGAKSSKLFGKKCYGWNLTGTEAEVLAEVDSKIQLKWLLQAYKMFPDKTKFFLLPKSGNMKESFFNKLVGNNDLWQQLKAGKTESEIRKSWEPALSNFKNIRKKYLLYEDFE